MDSLTDQPQQTEGLFRLIDIYCERTDFIFWSEPANAVTNLVIFMAGVLGLLLIKNMKSPTQKKWMVTLSILTMTIGVGSFLFHTLANYWSMLADVIPISTFMVMFLIWGLIYLIQLPTVGIVISVMGFMAVGLALEKVLPDGFLNGSGTYLHALAALMMIGHLIRKTHPDVARLFIVAIGIFALSLTFRSMDMAICQSFPLGTHFLWHTFNGCLLYVCLRIVARADQNQPAH